MKYSFLIGSLVLFACHTKTPLPPVESINGSLIFSDTLYRVRIDTIARDTVKEYPISQLPQSEEDISPENHSQTPYLGDDSTARTWSRMHNFKTFIALYPGISNRRLYYRFIPAGDSFQITNTKNGAQTTYKLSDPRQEGWTFITASAGGSWIHGDLYFPGGYILLRANWVMGAPGE